MSKKCAKCEKAVYPAEELKCLDKAWHKQCFKCWECGMQLTMKNYKGFNKLPYCTAHYPQTKATVVADTPESRRLKTISDLNSQVLYHANFEQNIKGTVTSVVDDPEMSRVKGLSSVISPNAYSGGGRRESEGYTKPMRSADDDDEEGPPGGYMPPPQGRMAIPVPTPPASSGGRKGLVYTALYDYEAQDSDEVGFQENDAIIDCEVVDDGWITGTVERTGQRGMIPANYAEPA